MSVREEWATLRTQDRVSLINSFADVLDAHARELAILQVEENGKLFKEMLGQAELFGDHLRYYASLLWMPTGYLVEPPVGGIRVHTERAPLGVVAALTPWNSPLNLLIWKLGPALAAGNTIVVKPSEVTPLSTLKLADLAAEAGIPAGVINVVTGGPDVGRRLVDDPRVAKIAFTGSSSTGEAIAASASIGLRPVSLELGGKSANIVFDDADLDQARLGVVAGIFGASGQTCMAGSRILVHAPIFESFLEGLVDAAENMILGDPTDPASEMGAVASLAHAEKIQGMVSAAVADGATIRAGGRREFPANAPNGVFYRPTILSGVEPTATIFQEEVFGPVACVTPFDTEDEAIHLANNSRFGLAGGVWTGDLKRASRVATRLRAGTVWVNNYRKVAMNVPFGGFGMSGLGRENGVGCLDEYSESKAVWTDLGLGVRDPFNPRARETEPTDVEQ